MKVMTIYTRSLNIAYAIIKGVEEQTERIFITENLLPITDPD